MKAEKMIALCAQYADITSAEIEVVREASSKYKMAEYLSRYGDAREAAKTAWLLMAFMYASFPGGPEIDAVWRCCNAALRHNTDAQRRFNDEVAKCH